MIDKRYIILMMVMSLLPNLPSAARTVLISTAGELRAFAQSVNAGCSYKGETVQLAQDVFLNDTTGWQRWDSIPDKKRKQWTPIGHMESVDSIVTFQGTFDGKGHSIYGLYIYRGGSGVLQGLFGVVENATVRNVSVKASVIVGHAYVGGIVAYALNASMIDNCHNYGKVTGTRNHVGGVVASFDSWSSLFVTNCSNHGNINGKCMVGGLIGTLYIESVRDSEKERKGGVVVLNCYNRGYVIGYSNVGGIVGVGRIAAGKKTTDMLCNCYNTGEIVAQFVAGGICGTLDIWCYADHFINKEYYGRPLFSNNYHAGTVSIVYSTAVDPLVGNGELSAYAEYDFDMLLAKYSSPCYYALPVSVKPLQKRDLVDGAGRNVTITSPKHFLHLPPEDMQTDDFVDRLNGFVDEQNGFTEKQKGFVEKHGASYKRWRKDTEGVNGGFPVFAE